MYINYSIKLRLFLIILLLGIFSCGDNNSLKNDVDVCIYGGTSSGIISAVAASKMGKSVVIITPKDHVGGMTVGGLGRTDVGMRQSISGLARDFYRKLGKKYGAAEAWAFEPHVAESVFMQMLSEEKIKIIYQSELIRVNKPQNTIESIEIQGIVDKKSTTISAKVFIDDSYEGDMMAKAGISYTVGREANSVYQEEFNGVDPETMHTIPHQFPDGVDPYIVEGDSTSGLVAGVANLPLADKGSGDKKIQAYNFRLCMTRDPLNKIPISRPANYDPNRYELLTRLIASKNSTRLRELLNINEMPGDKTDINSGNTGFSTDYIMGNWEYPEADYDKRRQIWAEHESYVKGLLFFLTTDNRVPASIREEMAAYGYPRDEFVNNLGFPHELYVREARRMIGEYVMTEHNCLGKEVVHDGIAKGSYNMDSHNVQRLVIDGMVKNEGEVTVFLPGDYPISYRAITPKQEECGNLLVPVCLSASHVAFGSIRMEPVFMALGQAAGIAASMAVDKETSVQQIDIDALIQKLGNDPYLDGRNPDIIVDWRFHKNQVAIKGDWQEGVEKLWSSKERYLYLDENASGKIRFSFNVPKNGRYEILFFNPKNKKLRPGKIPIKVKSASGFQTVDINPYSSQGLNTKMISLGSFSFEKGDEYYVELEASETKIPVQAAYIVIKSN